MRGWTPSPNAKLPPEPPPLRPGRTVVDGTYKGAPYRLSVGDVGSGTDEERQAILDEIQKILEAPDA